MARGVDAVSFLTNDHRALEEFFKMLDRGWTDRASVIPRIVDELTVHSELEEEFVYPVIRSEVSGGRKLASHAQEEHQELAKMLQRLQRLDPESSEAGELLQEVRQSVEQHYAEEQGPDGLFARLREAVGTERLGELGAQLSEAKAAKAVQNSPAESSTQVPPPRKDVGGQLFGV